MSVYRSYFLKNNTLIESNLTNNSQNPVTEISYGTLDAQVSRFIFDVDLSDLRQRIADGTINPARISAHTLHMTNTIRYAPQYIGKKSYSLNIDRASAFTLDFFNINQDWQEGNGYDFTYSPNVFELTLPNQPPNSFYKRTGTVLNGITGNTITGVTIIYNTYNEIVEATNNQASNWFYRATASDWTKPGAYISSGTTGTTGITQIIGNQRFEAGNEDIELDVTDYINQRLFSGYTGTTAYTGNSFGIGIKFPDYVESGATKFRQAVAFHAKHTNTFYEPYIETIIDDTILDDRNYFYLDKDNDLYLYVNIGNFPQDITVNKVDIYDWEDNLITGLTGSSIINVSKGIYKITLNIDSSTYPDAVLFRDVWSLTINGKSFTYDNDFYLISERKYYTFNLSNQIDFRNYFFYFWGINDKENIVSNGIRKVRLTIKELYPNQSNFLPLEIEYRLFTTVGAKYEIDIIPYSPVNRTSNGYEFDLDTSWLIPQDYYLQIRLKNGNYYENKQTISFTVVSSGIIS
jgi:hypothetical protein